MRQKSNIRVLPISYSKERPDFDILLNVKYLFIAVQTADMDNVAIVKKKLTL